ncbi:MAG: ABC transporter permease [Bdellovibrionota bacterium]
MKLIEQFKELFKYRQLVWALVTRHLAIRYRGSLLGFLWSFLNPLLLMLIYSLVFKYYIRFDHVENYSIFLFCGLLPWLCVVSSLEEGTRSLVSSGHLITKSMFPAQILPAVAVLTSLIHFVLALPMLFLFMIIAGMPIGLSTLSLPLVLTVQCVFLYGITLGLSALNVKYRDVQHVVGNVLTFLFFLCPIIYPVETVPEKYRFTMELNPFAVFTAIYHNILLDGVMPKPMHIVFVVTSMAICLLVGSMIFDAYKEKFAECL